MTKPFTHPDWIRSASIVPAYEDGELIGVEVRALITHDAIAELPADMVEASHRVLDKAAARDAGAA